VRDTTIVSILAYAASGPGKRLNSARRRSASTRSSSSGATFLGEIAPTKTGQTRTICLLQPLAKDLNVWRLANGRPDNRALVFAGHNGRPWTREQYQNWHKRIYSRPPRPAASTTPAPTTRPTGSSSLLIYEVLSVVQVARQAGHSPEMTLSTYAHAFDEDSLGTGHRSAEDQIRAARGDDVPVLYPRDLGEAENPSRGGRIRTADLLLPKQAR
jgi:hypothetical protein